MSISEKLDLAIKLEKTGTTDGHYETKYKGKTFKRQTYMTNAEWDAFRDSLQKNKIQPWACCEYCKGGGDELHEKNGCPPKMASFGSSSRLIYTLSCEKEGFHYEKQLPTTVGGKANLDGFYDGGDHYIFVEAKCHEPYSTKNATVSRAYEKLYEYINEQMSGNLHINMETSKCGKNMNVKYYADGEKLERFDMKQMICHLLGIATGMLSGTLEKKQTKFIYLLYDPTALEIEHDTKVKIDEIYNRTCHECNLVDFAKLFRVILTFLRDKKYVGAASDEEIDGIVHKFSFELKSQKSYSASIGNT